MSDAAPREDQVADLRAVETAAARPWVAAVTPPDYGDHNPHPLNIIDSEGVAQHNADLAQQQGITGAGVSVGVISNGVASLAQAQALNELPAVTVLSAGSGDEGTAMLEIVHDMAPGAALVFHANGSGTAGHVTAVTNRVAAGVMATRTSTPACCNPLSTSTAL